MGLVDAATLFRERLDIVTGPFVLRSKPRRAGLPRSPERILPVLGVVIAVITAGVTLLGGLLLWSEGSSGPGEFGVAIVCVVSYGGVGFLLTQRRPRHLAGWLLLGIAALLAVWFFAGSLIEVANVSVQVPWIEPGSLPSLAAFCFLSLVLIVGPLYLPDGRLPSPRWRFVPWLAAACWLTVSFLAWPGARLFGLALLPDNPGLQLLMLALGLVVALWGLFSIAFICILPFAAVLMRFRNSSGPERQQVKLILFAFVVMLFSLALGVGLMKPLGNASFYPFLISVSLLPLAIAVAVLRYGLYRIDALISGAFVYGTVTAILAAGFALISSALEGISEALFGSHSSAGVVTTTLILASAFGPLRRRVQKLVDKRLRPEDPSEYLAGLRGQLRFTAQAHSPLDFAAQLLDEALMTFEARAGRVRVDVAGGFEIERRQQSDQLDAQVSVPLEVRGVAIGVLELGPRRRELRYAEAEIALLRELCNLVAQGLMAYDQAHGRIQQGSDLAAISSRTALLE